MCTVLDNIIVARAYTHETQIQLLTMLAAKMSEEIFSLIVVDSATGTATMFPSTV